MGLSFGAGKDRYSLLERESNASALHQLHVNLQVC
jgi:hypothetical protein